MHPINDIEYQCVPSALFNTYGIKKDKSYDYLHSVYHGGLSYVKTILNRNNTSSQTKEIINYVNPCDEMIKMMKSLLKKLYRVIHLMILFIFVIIIK